MSLHRTRHSSLDCPASSHEEWTEFLSTSVMALSTAETEPSRAFPSIQSPTHGRHPFQPSEIALDRRIAKPRGMSMSETMSCPSMDAWRPLGRRAMSPPTTTITRSSSNSPESNSPLSLSDNQTEQGDTLISTTFGTPAVLEKRSDLIETKLQPSASFRGVVSSCLSSSSSSLVDAASSSDEEQQGDGNSPSSKNPPPPSVVDPSYAESCLPVLAQIPRPPRSISVDSGSGARPNSLGHVKSPVIGNRKDTQTWQLQDEESFFMTSPRFGPSLGNREEGQQHMFRGNSVGSLLSTDASNQQEEDEFQTHPRLTKESRASSVDFTLGRPHEINPPLPPPQEPLQRLRARSFSYSAAYGSSGYHPFNKQQYGHPPPRQQHMQQPQQTIGPDFPRTLRSFHAGSGIMQPGQPQPLPVGVRPPRVTIPTDSPMHQYQYGPPMPYCRYSETFTMPPYMENSYIAEQQENLSRQGSSGRVMRSYSMEYGTYPSTRQVRSQSMEGPPVFASAPQLEYSSSLCRSNSAGVTFDWSRGRMEATPPLPPDVRPVGGNGAAHFPPPPPEAYYDVEFKRGRQEVFAGRAAYKPGEYVKVEADRGEDIGRIVQRTMDISKAGAGNELGTSEDSMGRSKRHELPTKKILCAASQRELEVLNEQRKEEHEVFEVCKSKVRQRLLPMNVIDAEYQFDRHKLTFFFEADRRIDFRELVRDLFAIYKTRIWLQQVVPSGKKTGPELETS